MRQVLLTLLAVAVLGASVGAMVVFLGLYNVSARAGHWPGVSWILHTTFNNSVRLRAGKPATVPADLGDDRVALGAGHFDSACRFCHARPEEERSITTRSMKPVPPHVTEIGGEWAPEELHWIVREGAKMTGMPAWPADRDDEVWALVAFLEAAKTMTGAEYEALVSRGAEQEAEQEAGKTTPPESQAPSGSDATGDTGEAAAPERPSAQASLRYREDGGDTTSGTGQLFQQPQAAQALQVVAGAPEGLAYCATCHRRDGRSGNPHIPRLDIQSKDYLLDALRAYADDRRASGFMMQAVSMVSGKALPELAEYFASVPAAEEPAEKTAAEKPAEKTENAGTPPSADTAQLVERGRTLAFGQSDDRKVPACAACHGPVEADEAPPQLRAEFPALGGQYREYLEGQLHLWRETFRGGGQAAELMWQAAQELSDENIEALSAYYASLPPRKLPRAKDKGAAPR